MDQDAIKESKLINRRKFLTMAAAGVGGTVLVCGGFGSLASQSPQVDFLKESFQGESEMIKPVLVAYASKAGSTAEVASAIGRRLNQKGFPVEVCKVDTVSDVGAYSAVILGSAIRMGRWLPQATDFVETRREALLQVPVAYFTCCMTLREDSPEKRQKVMEYMAPVRKIVEPVSLGAFAGKMDYAKLSFLDRAIMQYMIKGPEGDYRNWEAIHSWSDSLVPLLG